MYTTSSDLATAVSTVFDGKKVTNPTLLQDKIIDELIFTAIFSENDGIKSEARSAIRQIAKSLGAVPSSINNYYMAIGRGEAKVTSTVPAINIRFMTYDTAKILFSLMMKHKAGPVIFEIARSEMGYTEQRPDEYAVAVLAAAVKTGYKGPVFLQGDHFQFKANIYKEDPEKEMNAIRDLIKESIEAEFLNIDIDASTLVDLDQATLDAQQATNYTVTSELTSHIRKLETLGTTISVGAEIGHIGGKNSTPEEFEAFMRGYLKATEGLTGISKISVQTGTSHGGIPLPDGTIAKVKLDFDVIEKIGVVARDKYHVGGVVQHGASTLPNDLFDQFPKHKTLEIHLATGFQNIVYDNMPSGVRDEIYEWLDANHQAEWDDKSNRDQNIYKTRKRAIGPFKEQMWNLSEKEKAPIITALEAQFQLLFNELNIRDTRQTLEKYV